MIPQLQERCAASDGRFQPKFPDWLVVKAKMFRSRKLSYLSISRRISELYAWDVPADTIKAWCTGRSRKVVP